MLAPGQLIDRYELVIPIGDGGMAQVWAARQRGKLGFEKVVALKVVHSRFAEEAAFRSMFLDEARIVSAIEHPNVAQVYDLNETGSLLYLVMEYVHGESLFGLLEQRGGVPLPIALRIAADTCAGLHAAHSLVDPLGQPRNIVHRDISPQNILVTVNGTVKLIDFGIAHARDRSAATTEIGTIKGKVRYMAPEQVRRERIGPFTDVFGVGATLFRMLAGSAPYAAENMVVSMQALMANAPPLVSLPSDTPASVASLIHRAIAPDPNDRFATARAMQDALEELLVPLGPSPDLAAWVGATLSGPTRTRHAQLAASLGTHDLESAMARPAAIPERAAPALGVPMPPPAAPLPQRESEEKERSFMDLGALAAHARTGTTPEDRPKAPGQQAAAPGAPAETVAEPKPPQKPSKKDAAASRTGRIMKLAIAATVLVVVTVGLLLLLPRIVRDRAIATAREAGFEITIDKVGVGFSGISLRGVKAKAIRIPGLNATIDEIYLAGLSGRNVRVSGMDARLEGRTSELEVPLAMLLADNRARVAGTPAEPSHLSLVGARLTWNGLSGEGSRLSAGEIGVELDSRGSGNEDVRGNIARFDLLTTQTTWGPWAASFERGPTNTRMRVIFDPPVPDGPSALLVWGRAAPPELTIKIPRAPFTNLGIKPRDLGLPAEERTELEATLHGSFPPTGRSEVTWDATLWGARPKGFSGAIDIQAKGAASGQHDKPLALEKATVTVGPFTAVLSGTVTPHPSGARLDVLFKTIPVPCERIVRAEAKTMGALAATLQDLAHASGAVRVTGSVNASGVVKYDTAQPEEAAVTWLAKETCGVSIFGM